MSDAAAPSPPPPDSLPRPVPTVDGMAPGVVGNWLDWATGELAGHSDSARADAEILLAALLGSERARLRLHHDDAIEAATVLRYAAWIERRKGGEPVAYIVGLQGFWTLDLVVDTAVLIPRPDTEALVEWALALLPAGVPQRLLDLGTGSGAIALALASERPACDLLATDVSEAALAVAGDNARRLGMASIRFRHGAWWDAVPAEAAPFDLIVSNPPYIAEGDAHLAALRYEPRLALTAGADGLDALRVISGGAAAHLRPGGWLLLEHGHDQGPQVQALLAAAGFTAIESRRDFGGNIRVTGGRRP